ncbi:myoferlin-like, partial [Chiloscyllium plagiosum]|uniref:myoferlin-like n=1 Tax=Chiloscyllium plagiosum TaxID=36176 RepID=UPI001CB8605D
GKKKRTSLSDEEKNVKWNEVLEFKLKGNPLDAKSSLQIHLKGKDKVGKGRFLGSVNVRLANLVGERSRNISFVKVPLLDKKKQKTKNLLSFEIVYEPPLVNKKETKEGKPGHPEQDDTINVPRLQEIPLRSQSPSPENASVRGTAKFAQKVSDKPQDFQVRVRIIEGRQLQGANIRPVVKVYVGDTVFRTRIKRGNNPIFDELFFQNFHKPPSEVFNTLIHLQVLNSHSLRADSMIGVFKLDIGSVYDLPDHAVLRKWLLLYEPDDVQSMAKGYLKVSIIILTAGDEAPIDKRGTNEEDDVESNLLQPAGILSRWVTFEVKIYRAEDISHMSKGLMSNLKHVFGGDRDKEGVDSFLEVSFAGRKVSRAQPFVVGHPVVHWLWTVSCRGQERVELESSCAAPVFLKGEGVSETTWANPTLFHLQPVSKANLLSQYRQPLEPLFNFRQLFLHIDVSVSQLLCRLPDLLKQQNLLVIQLLIEGSHLRKPFQRWQGATATNRASKEYQSGSFTIGSPPSDEASISTKPKSAVSLSRTVFMKQPLDKSQNQRTVAQLRVRIWMGLSTDEEEFEKYIDGKILVAAERYENQARVMGHWGTSGLLQHPAFSDASGKIRLSRKDFYPLRGWQWDGKWTIDPERCLLFDADAGHNEFTDEVYENETHLAGGEWSPALEQWTDKKGNRHLPVEEIECPVGWEWKEDWIADLYRAVDEHGWEYGKAVPPETMPRHWNPTEKAYHTNRRRRWKRERMRKPDRSRQMKREEIDQDGWEYAPLFGWKFHIKQNKGDIYRRRRWRRRLIPKEQMGPAAIFRLEGSLCRESSEVHLEDLEEQEKPVGHQELYGMTAPFISCILDPPNAFQFRGYIYQARGLLPTDISSSADPYIQVSLLHQSKRTDIIRGTLNPIWDQTLIFEEVEIYGNLREVVECPPFVSLELFDSNRASKHEYLGAALCFPSVRLDSTAQYVSALQWHPVFRGERFSGELLVSFELLMKQRDGDQNLPPRPPMRDSESYMVPLGVRPQLQLSTIEILAWGLRNIKNYNMMKVTSPSLVVECNGETIQTAPIKNYKKNPNFPNPIYFLTVFLPVDSIYSPPIVLKVLDYRPFGYKPVVGQTTVKSLSEFMCDPFAGSLETEDVAMMSNKSFHVETPNIESTAAEDAQKSEQEATEGLLEDDTIDWWCKFYASSGEHDDYTDYLLQGYDTIKIYPCPLEDIPQFKGLQDFCHTFKLYRGKVYGDIEDPMVVGEFKGSFRIYPLPEDPAKPVPPPQFRQLPSSEPQICLVRVYIVRALSLQPKDRSGTCDPYIKISLGKETIDDREHYIANNLNPVFGKMFQLYATVPLNKDLKVSVYDYDLVSQDDKIGETVIDLENRYLSRFGARCGLPRTYCISGSTQWRDQLTPIELLKNLSTMKNYALPVIRNNGQKITIGEKEFSLDDFEPRKLPYSFPGPPEERLALHILRLQNLVPEHVETRTLFNSTQPGIEQGKLQMWIDIFPKKLGLPGPPFNITPRGPVRYVLRCIVWNTSDVVLQETNIMGERMSDIYIKGWMVGLEEQKQNTDVHYRSLDGEGNFNWRFIFQFEYLTVERVLVINKKNYIWSLDETEMKMPPKLILQLWDNDKVSFDDYLGYLEINLNAFRCPTKWADNCTLEKFFKLEDSSSDSLQKMISLFKQKSIKGWWPCVTYEEGKPHLTGKLELTLELLTEREAEERPAGKGRDEPNMNPRLEPPNRPDTSFLWFRSPLKAMRHIVWRKYKWWLICTLLLVIPVIFLVALLHAIPNALANFLLQSTRYHRKKK